MKIVGIPLSILRMINLRTMHLFRPLLVLLLILTTFAVPLFAEAPSGNLDNANITTHTQLQSIHNGLRKYLDANQGVWPQPPSGLSPEDEQKWWIKTLLPHGVKEQDWINPKTANDLLSKDRPSYLPTAFDALPNTAYKWPTQPWVLEVGFADMDQLLALLPDGRIMTQKELFDLSRKSKKPNTPSQKEKQK